MALIVVGFLICSICSSWSLNGVVAWQESMMANDAVTNGLATDVDIGQVEIMDLGSSVAQTILLEVADCDVDIGAAMQNSETEEAIDVAKLAAAEMGTIYLAMATTNQRASPHSNNNTRAKNTCDAPALRLCA